MPRVTVVVAESSPLAIPIFGQVGNPVCRYRPWAGRCRLAQALAAAAGSGPLLDRIYVVRPGAPNASVYLR